MLLASLDAFGWGVLIFVGSLFGIPYTRFIARKIAIPGLPVEKEILGMPVLLGESWLNPRVW